MPKILHSNRKWRGTQAIEYRWKRLQSRSTFTLMIPLRHHHNQLLNCGVTEVTMLTLGVDCESLSTLGVKGLWVAMVTLGVKVDCELQQLHWVGVKLDTSCYILNWVWNWTRVAITTLGVWTGVAMDSESLCLHWLSGQPLVWHKLIFTQTEAIGYSPTPFLVVTWVQSSLHMAGCHSILNQQAALLANN